MIPETPRECIHGPLDGEVHHLRKRLLVVARVNGFPAVLAEQCDDEGDLVRIPKEATLVGRYHNYGGEARGLRWLPY